MSLDRAIMAFAGVMILVSILLTKFVHPNWFWLTVFIGALVFNLMRGLDVHCGCFSTAADAGTAGLWTVVRDLVFLAVSAYLTVAVLLKPSAAEG